MKDEINTFADYKALVKEYEETDSVSRRESIKEAIRSKAEELLHELIALYAKYGRDYVEDDDYREDRGWLSLAEFDEDKACMNYSDRWKYGGECYFGIEVPMKYLDDDEMTALEKKLREEHMSYIQVKRDALKRLKKAAEELKTEIEELDAEIKELEMKLEAMNKGE
jgi:transposase